MKDQLRSIQHVAQRTQDTQKQKVARIGSAKLA